MNRNINLTMEKEPIPLNIKTSAETLVDAGDNFSTNLWDHAMGGLILYRGIGDVIHLWHNISIVQWHIYIYTYIDIDIRMNIYGVYWNVHVHVCLQMGGT